MVVSLRGHGYVFYSAMITPRTTNDAGTWMSVGDADLGGERYRLAGQDVAVGDVVGFEHLVVRHLHLAGGELAGARTADALAAGERRVEALVDEYVEHSRPGWPGQPVGRAIQADLQGRGDPP